MKRKSFCAIVSVDDVGRTQLSTIANSHGIISLLEVFIVGLEVMEIKEEHHEIKIN